MFRPQDRQWSRQIIAIRRQINVRSFLWETPRPLAKAADDVDMAVQNVSVRMKAHNRFASDADSETFDGHASSVAASDLSDIRYQSELDVGSQSEASVFTSYSTRLSDMSLHTAISDDFTVKSSTFVDDVTAKSDCSFSSCVTSFSTESELEALCATDGTGDCIASFNDPGQSGPRGGAAPPLLTCRPLIADHAIALRPRRAAAPVVVSGSTEQDREGHARPHLHRAQQLITPGERVFAGWQRPGITGAAQRHQPEVVFSLRRYRRQAGE
eukprot:SAG31_NODE_158_length_21979_cov_6.851691_4_plen_270_part_00